MSEQDSTERLATGADGPSPSSSSPGPYQKKRRSGDATLKDQEAVREYLTFKQTRGLMTDSEKRLLDKIAAVCGMSIEIKTKV
ncbi:MAG: hypothetical protein KGS72_14195 [Cyanobacteria bacterium REEB67]|nr:hypothetical protein [Cyanobacteria bacterium REEB67]